MTSVSKPKPRGHRLERRERKDEDDWRSDRLGLGERSRRKCRPASSPARAAKPPQSPLMSSSHLKYFDHPPSKKPFPYFGDDLLRAERFEAEWEEQRRWSTKMEDVAEGDEWGSEGLVTVSGGEDAAWEEEMRRMSACHGKETRDDKARRSDEGALPGKRASEPTHLMTEEEHAEFIREGMRRRHQRRRKSPSAAHTSRKRSRAASGDAGRIPRTSDGYSGQQARRRVEKEAKQKRYSVEQARQAWKTTWDASDASEAPWTTSSVPWPIVGGGGREGLQSLTKIALHDFLFANTTSVEGAQNLRAALRRFHPDRFFSSLRYTRITDRSERESIRQRVEVVAQHLTEIVNERRT